MLQDQDLALAKLLQEQERAFLSIAGIQGYVAEILFSLLLFLPLFFVSKLFHLFFLTDLLRMSHLQAKPTAQNAALPPATAPKPALSPTKNSPGNSCKKKKQNFNAV
jgi:hypothetical protein